MRTQLCASVVVCGRCGVRARASQLAHMFIFDQKTSKYEYSNAGVCSVDRSWGCGVHMGVDGLNHFT